MTTINPTLDAVQTAIATIIEAQPWYRRFANTVNASLGGVAGALATLAAAYAATGRADSTAVRQPLSPQASPPASQKTESPPPQVRPSPLWLPPKPPPWTSPPQCVTPSAPS